MDLVNYRGETPDEARQRRAAESQERQGVRKLRQMLRQAGIELEPTPHERAARESHARRVQERINRAKEMQRAQRAVDAILPGHRKALEAKVRRDAGMHLVEFVHRGLNGQLDTPAQQRTWEMLRSRFR